MRLLFALSTLAFTGYFYCERCARIVSLPETAESPAKCPRCKKQTAVWHPPCIDKPIKHEAPFSDAAKSALVMK